MSVAAAEISILLPAFVAGLLVVATHVPLGAQVLARGIVCGCSKPFLRTTGRVWAK